MGSNSAAILINHDLSVLFDEAAALLLWQKVEDSDGRHKRVPKVVTTMGRLIRMG